MRRRGFTLIELLVAVLIIGALAALILGAIQGARESARRLRCLTNLRQIGLAMQGYAAREAAFPTGWPAPGLAKARNAGLSLDYSPFCRILPDLEQTTLFHTINFQSGQSTTGVNPEHLTASAVTLDVFLCPSDSPGVPDAGGPMNFRANTGAVLSIIPDLLESSRTGPFAFRSYIGLAQITDGLSSTALLSERLRGDGDPTRWDRRRDPWFAGLSEGDPDRAVAACAAVNTPNPPHYSGGGSSWFFSSFNQTLYNQVGPPNAAGPDCSCTLPYDGNLGIADCGVYSARSNHVSCVNVAMCDGSVRAVSDRVALPIWRALGTRAGSEPIGTSW